MKESLRKYWIAIAAAGLAFFMLIANRHYAEGAFGDAMHPLDSADAISSSILAQYPDSATLILKKQYAIFSYRKEHYKGLMEVFYTNYYAFNIILVIFTTLSGVAIFLLARKGWDGETPLSVKVAAVSFVFVASLFYLFSNVMDNKANIRNNLDGYVAASRQQLQILKDLNAVMPLKTDGAGKIDSLVGNNYDFLYNNLQYFFNIDDSKVSSNPMEQLSGGE